MTKRFLLALAAAAVPLLAAAQAYPAKPIHLVVPFPPGGPTDVLGRLLGQAFGESFGQAVIVENKVGAAGNIGVEQIAKAAPDGYTIGIVPAGNIAVNPTLFPSLPYKAAELAPVTMLATVDNVLVVNAETVPAKSLKELLELAANKPGTLSYASPGAGSQAHLAGALLELSTGVQLLHVPYRGIAPAVNDLVGGQVSMMFAPLQTALPFIRSGKLRALGVADRQRMAIMPDVPTLAEGGVPIEGLGWNGIFVPAGTPPPIIERLQVEISKVLRSKELQDESATLGTVAGGESPQEFAAFVRGEVQKWGKVIKDAGIKAE
jgi:tripartite-type tricarboxylate transporter receptor subunit TctC